MAAAIAGLALAQHSTRNGLRSATETGNATTPACWGRSPLTKQASSRHGDLGTHDDGLDRREASTGAVRPILFERWVATPRLALMLSAGCRMPAGLPCRFPVPASRHARISTWVLYVRLTCAIWNRGGSRQVRVTGLRLGGANLWLVGLEQGLAPGVLFQ